MRRVLVAALACALAGDAAAFTPAPALSFCGQQNSAVNRAHVRTWLEAGSFLTAPAPQLRHGVSLRVAPAGSVSKWDDPNYDPTKDTIDSNNPLHVAAYEGKVEEVKTLLADGADVNEPTAAGWTALMWAARGGKPEVLQVLKDAGGDLYAKNGFGSTPLHAAAHFEEFVDKEASCTKLLLEWMDRDKIDGTNNFGWTALHWAGKGGHPAAAKALMDKGADVKATNMKGNTPLHEACQNGKLDILQVLLDGGSDVHATTTDGETPVHIAAYLGFVDAVDVLLKAGAAVDPLDKEQASPLYRAARGGEVEVVELLLKAGADPNQVADNGWNGLHEAARWGREEVVELLLKAGADVNLKNEEGSTPLHLASLYGRAWDDADVLTILMEAGADADAIDGEGQTPLDIATADTEEDEWEDSDVIQALLAKMSNPPKTGSGS